MTQIPLIPAEVMALAERPPPPRSDRFVLMWWTPQGGWHIDLPGACPDEKTAASDAKKMKASHPNRSHFRIVKIPGEGN